MIFLKKKIMHYSHSEISASLATNLVTSGSHWAVREGHSSACVITKSYRNGVFFFHILYSSFITRSSIASSKPALEVKSFRKFRGIIEL